MNGLDNQIIRMLVHSSNQYIKEKSEVAEAKKEGEVTVLDSPAKLFYAIIGIIGGLIFLGGTVWAWHDGERGWVIWVFLLFVLLGVYIFGMGVFHKVILTDETITHCSSFFGIRRTYQLKKLSRVVYVADGDEIRVYKGRRKIFSMHDDMLSDIDESIEYFEKAGVKIEDLRPDFYNFRIEPKGNIKIVSKMAFVFFLAIAVFFGGVFVKYRTPSELLAMLVCLGISIGCRIYGSNGNRGDIKVVGEEIFYHDRSDGSDKIYNFSEITGYKLLGDIRVYKGNEEIILIEADMLGASTFLARLMDLKIPCLEDKDYYMYIEYGEQMQRLKQSAEEELDAEEIERIRKKNPKMGRQEYFRRNFQKTAHFFPLDLEIIKKIMDGELEEEYGGKELALEYLKIMKERQDEVEWLEDSRERFEELISLCREELDTTI